MDARPARQPKALPCRARMPAPDFSTPVFACIELGKTARGKTASAYAARPRLLKEPIYYYNMGCYEALLGNVQDAQGICKPVSKWMHLSASWRKEIPT